MNIKEIQDGMKRITIDAKIVEVGTTREIHSRFKDETYRIADAVLADETGTIKLTLWNDQIDQVKVADNVHIEGAYATSFKGETQVNVGKFGTMKVVH